MSQSEIDYYEKRMADPELCMKYPDDHTRSCVVRYEMATACCGNNTYVPGGVKVKTRNKDKGEDER